MNIILIYTTENDINLFFLYIFYRYLGFSEKPKY